MAQHREEPVLLAVRRRMRRNVLLLGLGHITDDGEHVVAARVRVTYRPQYQLDVDLIPILPHDGHPEQGVLALTARGGRTKVPETVLNALRRDALGEKRVEGERECLG